MLITNLCELINTDANLQMNTNDTNEIRRFTCIRIH